MKKFKIEVLINDCWDDVCGDMVEANTKEEAIELYKTWIFENWEFENGFFIPTLVERNYKNFILDNGKIKFNSLGFSEDIPLDVNLFINPLLELKIDLK